jgi:hypothetical protein
VGDGVFARLLAAIDNFTVVPSTLVLGRYGGVMKSGGARLDPRSATCAGFTARRR